MQKLRLDPAFLRPFLWMGRLQQVSITLKYTIIIDTEWRRYVSYAKVLYCPPFQWVIEERKT